MREQYDTAAYRRHCQRLAAAVVGAIELHHKAGQEVVLVGLEGSPSMGVCITSSDPQRGGRPQWPDGTDELTLGQGIFMDELLAALAARGIAEPRIIGITHQLPGHDEATERTRLQTFLKN